MKTKKAPSKKKSNVTVGGSRALRSGLKFSYSQLMMLALLVALVGTYFLWQSFAQSPSMPPVAGKNTRYNLGVLVLKYFPLTSNGQSIDINVTGDVSEPLSVAQQDTTAYTNTILSSLSKASTYLWYKYPTNQPSMTYNVVATHEYDVAVPIKASHGIPTYPDYYGMMQKENICNYVDNDNVKEVWLWAYQGPNKPGTNYPYLAISESKMSGPFGDISNSYEYNDMPQCGHTYRVYTFNYGRTAALAVHSWGHQLEAEMKAVDSNLFGLFQGPNYPQTLGVVGRCGSVHNPPNARSEYDWYNTTPQNSDCENWDPNGLGSTTAISCAQWSCDATNDNGQLAWQMWMWSNLPGMNNTKTYQGYQLRNWWDVHADFDNVMANSRTLRVIQPQRYQPSRMAAQVNGNLETYQSGQSSVWTTTMNGTSWGSWNSLGTPGSGITGGVTTAIDYNDLQELFMNDKSGSLWVDKAPLSGSSWSGWTSMGHPTVGFINSPFVAQNGDGRLEIFEVGTDRNLYHDYQTSANGSWSGWQSLGRPSSGSIQSIYLGINNDDRLEVFASITDGNLWHIWQTAVDKGWSSWSNFGNPGTTVGSIAADRNQNGYLDVYVNGSNGLLYHKYETSGGWSGWYQLSSQSGFAFPKFSSNGPMTAQAQNEAINIFEVGTNGVLYHNYQTGPNGSWSGWSNFGLPSGVSPHNMTLNINSSGELVLVMDGSDGHMWYTYETAPNKGWTSWAQVASPAGVSF